jgi:O-antigen ligase
MYWVRSRHKLRTALLVGGLAIVLLPLLPQQYWDRMNTITIDAESLDASGSGRLHFWQVARVIANDHPLFGVGTFGFQAAYDDYDTSDGLYGHQRAVHSTWFGVLADQGYVGLSIFATILIMAFRACGRARSHARTLKNDPELFVFAGAMQTALVTAAVGGTFLSYHYVEILWHFVGLSFAIERIVLYEPVAHTSNAPQMVRLSSTEVAGLSAPSSRKPRLA